MSISSILVSFPITQKEFDQLEDLFGDLVHHMAWQLKRRNAQNNLTDELEDIEQELRISIMRAASYYKRQVYIHECLRFAQRKVKDPMLRAIVKKLRKCWIGRKRVRKRRFNDHHEAILEQLIQNFPNRPSRTAELVVDTKFITYCKSIAWNCLKNMGKKISKERSLRCGLVSLYYNDFLAPENAFDI